jgi:transposase
MPQGRQFINGREYVYDYKSVWNKEKQRSEQKREYIGRIIDGEFVPSKRYELQQELSEKNGEKHHSPPSITECKRVFAGATHLFDEIGKLTGVERDLQACFPKRYKEILSLVYYLALEPHSPLYRFKRWGLTHEHPFGKGKDIPSQRSSELLSSITEDGKMEFLKRQASRRSEREYLFYDSTSVSSYSEHLKQVKYGNNKDGDGLAQINLALLFGHKSGLPIYYRKLPGNITDVVTVEKVLSVVDYLDIKKVMLVMDRGYYSEKNINSLMKRHFKFIIGAKMSLKLIQTLLGEGRIDFDRREHYNSDTGMFIKTQSAEWDYQLKPQSSGSLKEKRRIYIHIYYNDQHATDDKLRFHKKLDAIETDIMKGNMSSERERECKKYYDIKKSAVRGITFTPKQDAIDSARRNFGFFALLSNGIKDPVEALRLYRAKDMIEKAFNDLKDRLNMRRTSVSSEENLEGKFFIQFIALIYVSYLKQAMEKAGLFKNYTMQEVLDDLDVIEKYQLPGRKDYYGEITNKQKELYATLGCNPPS